MKMTPSLSSAMPMPSSITRRSGTIFTLHSEANFENGHQISFFHFSPSVLVLLSHTHTLYRSRVGYQVLASYQ
jgi:hypothetical protein